MSNVSTTQPQTQTQSTGEETRKNLKMHCRTQGGAAVAPLPVAASRFGAGAADEAAEASRPRGGGAEARCGRC